MSSKSVSTGPISQYMASNSKIDFQSKEGVNSLRDFAKDQVKKEVSNLPSLSDWTSRGTGESLPQSIEAGQSRLALLRRDLQHKRETLLSGLTKELSSLAKEAIAELKSIESLIDRQILRLELMRIDRQLAEARRKIADSKTGMAAKSVKAATEQLKKESGKPVETGRQSGSALEKTGEDESDTEEQLELLSRAFVILTQAKGRESDSSLESCDFCKTQAKSLDEQIPLGKLAGMVQKNLDQLQGPILQRLNNEPSRKDNFKAGLKALLVSKSLSKLVGVTGTTLSDLSKGASKKGLSSKAVSYGMAGSSLGTFSAAGNSTLLAVSIGASGIGLAMDYKERTKLKAQFNKVSQEIQTLSAGPQDQGTASLIQGKIAERLSIKGRLIENLNDIRSKREAIGTAPLYLANSLAATFTGVVSIVNLASQMGAQINPSALSALGATASVVGGLAAFGNLGLSLSYLGITIHELRSNSKEFNAIAAKFTEMDKLANQAPEEKALQNLKKVESKFLTVKAKKCKSKRKSLLIKLAVGTTWTLGALIGVTSLFLTGPIVPILGAIALGISVISLGVAIGRFFYTLHLNSQDRKAILTTNLQKKEIEEAGTELQDLLTRMKGIMNNAQLSKEERDRAEKIHNSIMKYFKIKPGDDQEEFRQAPGQWLMNRYKSSLSPAQLHLG